VTTGVLGRSHPGNGRGVVGESRNGWAVLGSTTTGWAGVFHGRAIVFGGFFVWGGPKSAVVPHPDGSHRQLYTLESPESWFEDFGRGEVVNGRGRVELDPDFAAVVRSDDYHVFLSPEGNSNGLFVSERAPDGFEVREQRRGRSRLSFSYRVAARRRDVEVERLARAERSSPRPSRRRSACPPSSRSSRLRSGRRRRGRRVAAAGARRRPRRRRPLRATSWTRRR
jgi:hypothetical protein